MRDVRSWTLDARDLEDSEATLSDLERCLLLSGGLVLAKD